MICIAVGLHDLGLKVEFRTDHDLEVQSEEKLCYGHGRECGIRSLPALPIEGLVESAGMAGRVIVALDDEIDAGHYSPATKGVGGMIFLAYEDPQLWPVDQVELRRDRPGICRQSVTVFPQ